MKSVLQQKSWKSQYLEWSAFDSFPQILLKKFEQTDEGLKVKEGKKSKKNMSVFKDNQKSWKSQYWEWSACNRFPQILHYSNPQSEMPRLL